ncbi:MAG: hypothetical protein AB1295_03655 [Candidatus Micrarchaeota archaeon]
MTAGREPTSGEIFLSESPAGQLDTIDRWTEEGDHQRIALAIDGELMPQSAEVIEHAKSRMQEAIRRGLEKGDHEVRHVKYLNLRSMAIEIKFLPAVLSRFADLRNLMRGVMTVKSLLDDLDLDPDSERKLLEAMHALATQKETPKEVRNAAFKVHLGFLERESLEKEDVGKVIEIYGMIKKRGYLKAQREAARSAIERIREAGEMRHGYYRFVEKTREERALKAPDERPISSIKPKGQASHCQDQGPPVSGARSRSARRSP